jgi:hypothetical protein
VDAPPLPGEKLRIPVHPRLFRHVGNRRIRTLGAHQLSLIRSLIQLRPGPFGAHHERQAAKVTNLADLRRTQACRLGKRVGGNGDSPLGERKVRARRVQRPDANTVLTTAVDTWGRSGTPRCPNRSSGLIRRTVVDSRGLAHLISGRLTVQLPNLVVLVPAEGRPPGTAFVAAFVAALRCRIRPY